MQTTITPQDFVNKWKQSQVKERPSYQEHFIDICHLIRHATPRLAKKTLRKTVPG